MIRLHTNGNHGILRVDDRAIDTAEVRARIVNELYGRGLTLAQVAEVFGCHKSTVCRMVNGRRDPAVEPLFGSGEWTPEIQDQDPRRCERCGGDDGVIQRGSTLYCAACHRSGFDRELREQKTVAEIAEKYVDIENDYQAAAKRKPLAQRRKIKRA